MSFVVKRSFEKCSAAGGPHLLGAYIYIYIKKVFSKMQRGKSHPLGVVGGGDVACRGGREESVCAGGQKVVKRRQG